MTQTSDLSRRTAEEIFSHHAQALGSEDLEATILDYTEDSVLITPDGVMRGKAAIRDFFNSLFQSLPKAQWSVKTLFVDNILFLQWTADSTRASVSDGVDTFIFKDGMILIQTVRSTIVPKGL
jgi:hypothetical protein